MISLCVIRSMRNDNLKLVSKGETSGVWSILATLQGSKVMGGRQAHLKNGFAVDVSHWRVSPDKAHIASFELKTDSSSVGSGH